MFKKVIIAEDMSSINEGLKNVLVDQKVSFMDMERYCDDVYVKIKRALKENEPYDLLITDLYFKEDYRTGKIKNGEDLLKRLNQDDITIKKLVFSQDDRIEAVRRMFDKRKIDAYVVKGRYDHEELRKAMSKISKGERYASESVDQALHKKSALEITDYDIELLQLMEKGFNQKEVTQEFADKGLSPRSSSAIEKRLKQLKTNFKARNSIQLIAKAKDLGVL